jgi:hypothetical protein
MLLVDSNDRYLGLAYAQAVMPLLHYFIAVPYLTLLIAGLLPRGPEFAPRAVRVGFVADRDRFMSESFGFLLSVSLNGCTVSINVSLGGWTVGSSVGHGSVHTLFPPFAIITIYYFKLFYKMFRIHILRNQYTCHGFHN